jgi:hypothetical protein
MSTYNRLSYLGSKGNYAVNNGKASGDPIFTGSRTAPFNVMAGEIVVFDPRANGALTDADVATAKHISVAVGVGVKGDVAKELRYLGGETFDLCNFEMKAEAAAPVCSQPQILYTFYDGTTCENAATIMYLLDDHIVRDRYNFNERAKYIFTANPPCTDCGSCTATDNGDAIRDSFVDQINAKKQENPFTLSHFQNRDISHQYQPFRALKLYDGANSLKTFCLSLGDGACEDCIYLGASGITGIKIDGVETDFTYTNITVGADLQTLPSQIDRVIEQINTALGANGQAYRSKGIGGCCPYSITISVNPAEISTVAIVTEDADVNPCEEVNPFDSTTYSHGHAVIVDPVTIDCLCDLPPDDVPNYYGRTLKAEAIGDGWGCNKVETIEKQAQVLPEGFGYFWQDLERYQHRGGSGRDFRNSDRYRGKTYTRPDRFSRTMAAPATIDCDVSYCMYSLVTTSGKLNKYSNALKTYNTDGDWVLVPEGDSTTKTSWELYLNAMYERGICNAPNVTCASVVPSAESVTVLPATGAISTDGGTLQLTKSVFPSGASQAGTWSTSNAGFATVSVGGLVTAVGNGTVTITFTSTDGGFTDTSVITVTNQV